MEDNELTQGMQAKLRLDKISPTACTVKWKHATVNLAAGHVKSCCHQRFRKIENLNFEKGFEFHDTQADRHERQEMLEGKRSENCRYCWWIEDNGHLSDRSNWSSQSWMSPFTDDVEKNASPNALTPSWIELNFSSVCNLKCSYCSPIFSTSWMSEIVEHGAYPTSQAHNKLETLHGLGKLSEDERAVLEERFWPWFEKAYENLRLLKITGGEPLLSPHTFRVFEWVNQHPNSKLNFSMNSNLMAPEKVWNQFVERVIQLGKNANFYLQPSVDTYGRRAEYIRYGLDFEKFQTHVEDYLERTGRDVIFICTLNNLSLGGLTRFWEYLRKLKRRFGHRGQNVSLTTELLHSPPWQNLNVLPAEYVEYLDETIAFAEKHRGNEKWNFSEKEITGLYRAKELLLNPPGNLREIRKDGYRFFTEHDRRRGTNLLKTFPEMRSFWELCAKAAGAELPTEHPLVEKVADIKLRVILAPYAQNGIVDSAKKVTLTYKLENTVLVEHWLEMLENDLEDLSKPIWFGGVFYGRLFNSNRCSDLVQLINQALVDLEAPGGNLFKPHINPKHDYRSLDKIHELKAELMKLSNRPGFEFPIPFISKLDELNFLIHRLEFSLNGAAQFGAVVAVPFPPLARPLETEDYESFEQDDSFGGLYLDYATNGVEATDCFRQGITQVPTLQSRMTTGFQLSFGQDRPFGKKEEFKEWLAAVHPEIDAVANKGFGRGRLGQLEFSSEKLPALKEALAHVGYVEWVEVLRGE